MLRSNICGFSDTYIVITETINVKTENDRAVDGYNRNLILKNNAPFTNSISKINKVLINNAEDLDVVMPTYNLIEYSKNYLNISGTSWNYARDILLDPIF